MGRLVEFASNHPLLVLGLFAAWGAVMYYELSRRARGVTQVSSADAVKLINKGAIVVDVRESEAYQGGHIVNARNVSLKELQSDQSRLKKQKNKVLLTVCDNGMTCGKAANLLRKAGYEKVFSLKGGLKGWQADNYPLVK